MGIIYSRTALSYTYEALYKNRPNRAMEEKEAGSTALYSEAQSL